MSMTTFEFDYLRRLVREQSAIVLESGKEYLVEARLAGLVREQGMSTVTDLVAKLRGLRDGPLHTQVVEAITTNETLRKEILPGLIERRRSERRLHIWSAACSSGQEPYSLAMLLAEHFGELAGWEVGILATDLSTAMLTRAREGSYSQLEVNRGLPAAAAADGPGAAAQRAHLLRRRDQADDRRPDGAAAPARRLPRARRRGEPPRPGRRRRTRDLRPHDLLPATPGRIRRRHGDGTGRPRRRGRHDHDRREHLRRAPRAQRAAGGTAGRARPRRSPPGRDRQDQRGVARDRERHLRPRAGGAHRHGDARPRAAGRRRAGGRHRRGGQHDRRQRQGAAARPVPAVPARDGRGRLSGGHLPRRPGEPARLRRRRIAPGRHRRGAHRGGRRRLSLAGCLRSAPGLPISGMAARAVATDRRGTDAMIVVTRFHGRSMALNCDLIECAAADPDTVLTLVDGTRFVIRESLDEVIDKVRDFRASVVTRARALEQEATFEQTLRLVPDPDLDA